MTTGELRTGANMAAKTRTQRLEEIRSIAEELHCDESVAAAIYIDEQYGGIVDIIYAYIRARHSGDKQAIAVYESLTNKEQGKK